MNEEFEGAPNRQLMSKFRRRSGRRPVEALSRTNNCHGIAARGLRGQHRQCFRCLASTRSPRRPVTARPMANGDAAAKSLIHQHQIWGQFQRKGDGLSLSETKTCFGNRSGNRARNNDFYLLGQRRMDTEEFVSNGRRYGDTTKYSSQKSFPASEKQCSQR